MIPNDTKTYVHMDSKHILNDTVCITTILTSHTQEDIVNNFHQAFAAQALVGPTQNTWHCAMHDTHNVSVTVVCHGTKFSCAKVTFAKRWVDVG